MDAAQQVVLFGGGARPAPPVTLTVPSALGFSPPFSVFKSGSVYSHNFNLQAVKPSTTSTIYVGVGGDNTKNGLTFANRVRSLFQGVTLANALGGSVLLMVDPASYRYSNVDGSSIHDNFNGILPSCNLVVVPNGAGQIVSVHDQTMPAFTTTTDPNIYVTTYTTEVPNQNAWDLSHLNAFGRPQALRNVSGALDGNTAGIIAAINAMQTLNSQGAFYLDVTNKKLYARLSDNRAPDANLVVGRGSTGNANARNLFFSPAFGTNQTFWATNLDLWGGNPFYNFVNAPDSNPTLTAWLGDCATCYSVDDNYHWDGAGSSFLLRHVNTDSYKDGYNYSAASVGSAMPRVYELDCSSSYCGNDNNSGDSSSNSTSAHNAVKLVRVNCSFQKAQNRSVHDIEQVVSWNLGVSSQNCRQATGDQSADFACGYDGDVGDTCQMYLDGCKSSGSLFNLQAYKGGSLYTVNMVTTAFLNRMNGGYIGTYAANGTPDPVPAAVPGLLAGLGAINSVSWSKTNMTTVTGQTDPYGGTTATELQETTANGNHLWQSVAVAKPAVAQTRLVTRRIKVVGANTWVAMATYGAAFGNQTVLYYDLGTGSVSGANGFGGTQVANTANIMKLPNGFYEISLKVVTDASAAFMVEFDAATGAFGNSYIGAITNGLIDAGGGVN